VSAWAQSMADASAELVIDAITAPTTQVRPLGWKWRPIGDGITAPSVQSSRPLSYEVRFRSQVLKIWDGGPQECTKRGTPPFENLTPVLNTRTLGPSNRSLACRPSHISQRPQGGGGVDDPTLSVVDPADSPLMELNIDRPPDKAKFAAYAAMSAGADPFKVSE
jgi:hypothetical protein